MPHTQIELVCVMVFTDKYNLYDDIIFKQVDISRNEQTSIAPHRSLLYILLALPQEERGSTLQKVVTDREMWAIGNFTRQGSPWLITSAQALLCSAVSRSLRGRQHGLSIRDRCRCV